MGATCCSATNVANDAPKGGNVKIFGMPPSMNCVGPIMLAMETKSGGMEMCNLMEGAHKKPEYLAINPAGQVPGLDDGLAKSGESLTILRYVAMQYGPQYYPVAEPSKCVKIDFALDHFGSVAKPHMDVVYPVFGFKDKPADQPAANNLYGEAIAKWLQIHLAGKFVLGDAVSIADFKAVPFFFAAMQPAIKNNTGFTPPARMVAYVENFIAIVGASTFMKEAGGYSIKEFAASKAGQAVAATPEVQMPSDVPLKIGASGSAGAVKVFGMPPSCNCAGAIMLAMETKSGNFEMCDLMSGAHKKPEYMAINPLGQVPGLSDGSVCAGESITILRYLAIKYGKQFYPVDRPVDCCKIDFALDDFGSVYSAWCDVAYPVFGFSEPPANQAEANAKCIEKVNEWLDRHVKGKFVLGDKVSIADFKAAPYFWAASHAVIKQKQNFAPPARMIKYAEDFNAAVGASSFMKSAGGFSIAEFLASKA